MTLPQEVRAGRAENNLATAMHAHYGCRGPAKGKAFLVPATTAREMTVKVDRGYEFKRLTRPLCRLAPSAESQSISTRKTASKVLSQPIISGGRTAAADARIAASRQTRTSEFLGSHSRQL